MDPRTEMLQDKEHTDVAFPGAAKRRGAAAPACLPDSIPPTIVYNKKIPGNSQLAL